MEGPLTPPGSALFQEQQGDRMELAEAICSRLVISMYIGVLMFEAISIPLSLFYFRHPLAAAHLALQVLLIFIPLPLPPPLWAQRLLQYSLLSFAKWCCFKLTYEDREATFVKHDTPCVIGYEPHSVLPVGLPLVFSDFAPQRAELKSINTLATSMVDWCPIIRHLFFWLGGRPASRRSMHSLLQQGGSVVVVPGGVAECAYMGPGKDVVYLKSRKGFVRGALQHGAQLVPVYCFGQNEAYHYVRLGPPLVPQWLVHKFVRIILFCPMLIFGYLGTPLPERVQLHMVIGKPIALPRREDPSDAEVQHYLEVFIAAIQRIYDAHKEEAGYPQSQLVVM